MPTSLLQPQGSKFYLRKGLSRREMQPTLFLSATKRPFQKSSHGPHSNLLEPHFGGSLWTRLIQEEKTNKQKGQERSRLLQGLTPDRTKRRSRRFLSIRWGRLLSTFKSRRVPLQLFKSYGAENSIAERNVAFVIKSSFFCPFSKPTGTNWTETWLFKRLKSCHPPGSNLWPCFVFLRRWRCLLNVQKMRAHMGSGIGNGSPSITGAGQSSSQETKQHATHWSLCFFFFL